MAPEIMAGTPYLPPLADLWALGVILFFLATGAVPWKAQTEHLLMREVASGVVTFPEGVSPECESLIRRFLKQRPAERISCAEALADEWFAGCTRPLPKSDVVSLVSLKRIDGVLRNEEDLEPPICIPRSTSTGDLEMSFKKQLAQIRIPANLDLIPLPPLPRYEETVVAPQAQMPGRRGSLRLLLGGSASLGTLTATPPLKRMTFFG